MRTVSFPDYRFTFPQVCVFVTVCSSAQQHFTALHLQSCSRMSIIPPICSTIIKLVSNTLNYSNWLQTAPRMTFYQTSDLFKKNQTSNSVQSIQRQKSEEHGCRSNISRGLHVPEKIINILTACAFTLSVELLTKSALWASATRSGAAAWPCSLSRA